MPIPIILQLNEPLCIDHQFERNSKLSHNAPGEASEDEQRCIPWKCQYTFQPFCHSINFLDKKCHIFTWVLVYAIPSEFPEYLLDQSYDDITCIKHLFKINIEVGNPPMLNPIQRLTLLLHPFNKSGIQTFNKKLLCTLKINDVLIVIAIILGILLKHGYHTE